MKKPPMSLPNAMRRIKRLERDLAKANAIADLWRDEALSSYSQTHDYPPLKTIVTYKRGK